MKAFSIRLFRSMKVFVIRFFCLIDAFLIHFSRLIGVFLIQSFRSTKFFLIRHLHRKNCYRDHQLSLLKTRPYFQALLIQILHSYQIYLKKGSLKQKKAHLYSFHPRTHPKHPRFRQFLAY